MRSFLFTILLTLFSLPAFGHEARVNPEQRNAIRERLFRSGCVDAMGAVAPGATRGLTRSLTRGATRGVSVGEESLPLEVEKYDYYFSQLIPVELDLPYGKEGDPKSHVFFRKDPYEGPEKIAIQTELGLKWGSRGAPTETPTWMEFAKNYREALKKRGIPPDSTFVPAIVLYRDLGEVMSETTGKLIMKREYRFIDPLTEKFPDDMSLWKVLNKDVEFNIPFAPIFEAMQQGKFPLLDAVHDVSHFVSFLRFPEFAQSVRRRMVEVAPTEVNSGFKGREYWLTEALSLPDPGGQVRNHKFLGEHKRSTKVRKLAQIEKELGALSEAKLIEYSYQLAQHFESELRDVSGGNSSAPEKWYYLSESFGMKAEDLLNEDIKKSKPIGAVMGLSKIYFENAPVTLHANAKALTNETATFSFSTFVTAQKLLALSLKDNQLGEVPRREALDQLIHFASRTEHLLTTKPFTYTQWAEAFLKGNLSKSDPLAQTLTTVFNNDIVTSYYLGEGAKRPAADSSK